LSRNFRPFHAGRRLTSATGQNLGQDQFGRCFADLRQLRKTARNWHQCTTQNGSDPFFSPQPSRGCIISVETTALAYAKEVYAKEVLEGIAALFPAAQTVRAGRPP
jgi:hypothetical protein